MRTTMCSIATAIDGSLYAVLALWRATSITLVPRDRSLLNRNPQSALWFGPYLWRIPPPHQGRSPIFNSIAATIAGFITAVIATLGYPGVAALMALESAGIPIPSEVIMPFSGYLASTGRFNLLIVATVGALGCNVGSTAAYAIGAHGGRNFLDRWGHYFLLNRAELNRIDRFFHRFGAATVLIGRLLPVVRTYISFPAGIARMPFWKFQIYTFIGSWPWCFALAYAGFRLGKAWEANPSLNHVMHLLDFAVIGLVVLAVAWYAWRIWRGHASDP